MKVLIFLMSMISVSAFAGDFSAVKNDSVTSGVWSSEDNGTQKYVTGVNNGGIGFDARTIYSTCVQVDGWEGEVKCFRAGIAESSDDSLKSIMVLCSAAAGKWVVEGRCYRAAFELLLSREAPY